MRLKIFPRIFEYPFGSLGKKCQLKVLEILVLSHSETVPYGLN